MKLSQGLNIICIFLFIYMAQAQQPQRHEHQQQTHQQRHHAKRIQQLARTRKIYAMCPPGFTKIGNECYFLSPTKASWLDSHFECKDKNSKLAEPIKFADRLLRKFFTERGRTRGEIWIGGMYNWQRMKWQWGYNGKDMTYQSFSQMKPGGSEDLKYNCAVLNPELKYRWSAKLCFEKHFYLCQHRMPYVSERSRQRVYAKWNETFPGQFANEIQVFVTSNGTNRREYYRATSKRPNTAVSRVSASRDQVAQPSNQVPSTSRYNGVISNEINPPEVVGSRDASKLRRNKKQQKDRKQNKQLKLSGNVDLGNDMFKKQPRKKNSKKPSKTTVTTTQHPNTISEDFQPNHHRHNHYDIRQQPKIYRKPQQTPPPTTTTYRPPIIYQETSTQKNSFALSTSTVKSVDDTTLSELATKILEKKQRIANVRSKISKLTEEEKLEYMKLKAERKAAKMKLNSINDTIP